MTMNSLTAAELKRRGMAAIEAGLRRGPLHLVKHNKLAAVVLTEAEYLRLANPKKPAAPGLSVIAWLTSQPARGTRTKAAIDRDLKAARDW